MEVDDDYGCTSREDDVGLCDVYDFLVDEFALMRMENRMPTKYILFCESNESKRVALASRGDNCQIEWCDSPCKSNGKSSHMIRQLSPRRSPR